MKFKTLLLASAVAIVAMCYTSCKKSADSTPSTDTSTAPTVQATSDQNNSDNLADDANNAMNENVAAADLGYVIKGGAPKPQNPTTCATVTVPAGPFPKTITVVFNNCPSSWNIGIVRNGTMNILITGPLLTVGSQAIMTFSNYTVTYGGNTFKVEGTYTWTHTAETVSSRSWTRDVTNGKITNNTTGHYWLHSGLRSVTQNFNGTVGDPADDTFTVAAGGYHQVTNSLGVTHYDTIMTTLTRYLPCRWIHDGTIKIKGPYHSALLDFGYNPTSSSTCDDDASYTIDGTYVFYFHMP
jgi:hypothetical protein